MMIYGVTIDDIRQLDDICIALAALPIRPWARIVFDHGMKPSDYAEAVRRISGVATILGCLVDSSDLTKYSLDQYTKRAQQYVKAFAGIGIVWEIGNEVNGEWCGSPTDVAAKIDAAYHIAKSAGEVTALTTYYNSVCFEKKSNELFAWLTKYLPTDIARGVEYALISYYEEDCKGAYPVWDTVFHTFGAVFPNAKLGIGECGIRAVANKAAGVKKYYQLNANHPRYVGGYFWWYFLDDMVPTTKPLFETLSLAIRGV